MRLLDSTPRKQVTTGGRGGSATISDISGSSARTRPTCRFMIRSAQEASRPPRRLRGRQSTFTARRMAGFASIPDPHALAPEGEGSTIDAPTAVILTPGCRRPLSGGKLSFVCPQRSAEQTSPSLIHCHSPGAPSSNCSRAWPCSGGSNRAADTRHKPRAGLFARGGLVDDAVDLQAQRPR